MELKTKIIKYKNISNFDFQKYSANVVGGTVPEVWYCSIPKVPIAIGIGSVGDKKQKCILLIIKA